MIPNNVLNVLSKFNPNVTAFQNMNSPDEVAQYLLNSGKVNQEQVNRAKQMWGDPYIKQQIQQNPMLQSFLRNQGR